MTFTTSYFVIFFLYVVIVSEKLFSIISCSFKKQLRIVGHLNICLFFWIYFIYFYFRLVYRKIYSFPKISYNNDEDANIDHLNSNKMTFLIYIKKNLFLGKYLLYSFIIYLIFLLTTKCETKFLLVFY